MPAMPSVVVHASTIKGPALFKVDASGTVLMHVPMLPNEQIVGVDENQQLVTSLCGNSTAYAISSLEPTPLTHRPVYRFGAFSIRDSKVTEMRAGREHGYAGQVGAAFLEDKKLYVIGWSVDGTHLQRLGGGEVTQFARLEGLSWLNGLVVRREKSLALCATMFSGKEALSWIDMSTGKITRAIEVQTSAFPGEETYDRYSGLALFDKGNTLAWCTRDGLNLLSVDWAQKKLGPLRTVKLQ